MFECPIKNGILTLKENNKIKMVIRIKYFLVQKAIKNRLLEYNENSTK
jgi:hypothetical protein